MHLALSQITDDEQQLQALNASESVHSGIDRSNINKRMIRVIIQNIHIILSIYFYILYKIEMRSALLLSIILMITSKFSGVYEYTPASEEYGTVFANDGGRYFTATNDGEVKYYIVNETGFYNIVTEMIGLPKPMFSITSTGSHIIASKNGIVYFYQVLSNSFSLLLTYNWGPTIRVAALSDDGDYGFCGDVDGTLLVIHVPTGSSQFIEGQGFSLWSLRPSSDGSTLVVGGDEKNLCKFTRTSGTYSLSTNVNLISQIIKIESALDFLFVLVLCLNGKIYIYRNMGGFFMLNLVFQPVGMSIKDFSVDRVNFQYLVTVEMDDFVRSFIHDGTLGFTLDAVLDMSLATVTNIAMHVSGQFFIVNSNTGTSIFYNCGSLCESCDFSACLVCEPALYLVNGNCQIDPPPVVPSDKTPCVDGVVKNGVCSQYCAQQCKTCRSKRTRCVECSEYYMQEGDTCVVESVWLKVAQYSRPYLSICRRNWVAPLYLLLEDLWLYSYHEHTYRGSVGKVLEVVRLVEDKKWAIEPLSAVLEAKRVIQGALPSYNRHTNAKFLLVERHDQHFFKTCVEYYVFYVPCMLLIILLLNRLFFLLFDYRISLGLRLYSFWATLWVVALEGNIEAFVFAIVRTLLMGFSSEWTGKVLLAGAVVFGFGVFVYAVGAYYVFKFLYGRLSKYYLHNMYRLGPSFALMTAVYGLRPLARAAIHALLYHQNQLQLLLLGAVEGLVVVAITTVEFGYGVHICKLAVLWKVGYHSAFWALNWVLALSVEHQGVFQQAEHNLVLAMMGFCVLDSFTLLVSECCKEEPQQEEPDAPVQSQHNSSHTRIRKRLQISHQGNNTIVEVVTAENDSGPHQSQAQTLRVQNKKQPNTLILTWPKKVIFEE